MLVHRRKTVAGGVLLVIAAACLAPRIGTEFLPALEEGNFWIRATMPPTISLEAGAGKVSRMRAILKSHPEVLTVVSQHGRPDDGSDSCPFGNVELFVPLKPFDQWEHGLTKEKLVNELQGQFAREMPGISFNFSQYIQDNVEEGLSGVKGANAVKIIGPDMKVLEGLATKVMAEMGKIRGVTDLGVFRVLGQPNFNITVDREKAARYGLNAGDVNLIVQTAVGGTQATTVIEGERQFAPERAPHARVPREHGGHQKHPGWPTPDSEGDDSYVALKAEPRHLHTRDKRLLKHLP